MNTQATPTAEALTRRQMETRRREEMDELFRQIDLIHQQHQRRTDRVLSALLGLTLLIAVVACVALTALAHLTF